MSRVRVVLFVLTMVLLAAACGAQTDPDADATRAKNRATGDRVILKVGDRQITEKEFETRIGDIESEGGDADKGPVSKNRRRLGDDYASVLMLSQQALASHLDATPEVSRQLEIGRIQILSDAEFATLMKQAHPTQEEIESYYKAHIAEFDEVHARRLFIWKKTAIAGSKGLQPEEVRARADEILKASADGRDASALVDRFKNSDAGLLDPEPLLFPRGELAPAIEKVAFAAKEGEWVQGQDTKDSIILLHLAKHEHRQVGEVSSMIEKRIQGEKMQALLDGMKKKAGIWMDEQYFGTATAPVPEAQRSSK